MKNTASIPATGIPSLFPSSVDGAVSKPVSILSDLNDDAVAPRVARHAGISVIKLTSLLLGGALLLLFWQWWGTPSNRAIHSVAVVSPATAVPPMAMETVIPNAPQRTAIIRDKSPMSAPRPQSAGAVVGQPDAVHAVAASSALMLHQTAKADVSPLSEQAVFVNGLAKPALAKDVSLLSAELSALASDALPDDVIATALARVPGVAPMATSKLAAKPRRAATKSTPVADSDVEIITAIIEGRMFPE